MILEGAHLTAPPAVQVFTDAFGLTVFENDLDPRLWRLLAVSAARFWGGRLRLLAVADDGGDDRQGDDGTGGGRKGRGEGAEGKLASEQLAGDQA